MATKRNREISIRVTDDELEKMKKRQSSGTLAGWLRELALGIVPTKKADPDLILTLGRIGSNLNQIARHANTEKNIDNAVLNEIKIIRELINTLVEENIAQSVRENEKNDC